MRRDLAVVLALIAALALVTGLSAGTTGGQARAGSSYESQASGAKALYLVMERLGFRVERRAEPLGDLADAAVLVLLAPQGGPGGSDLDGLRAWIERGGTLVYGPSGAETDPLPWREFLGARVRRFGEDGISLRPASVSPELAPAHRITVEGRAGVEVGGESEDAWRPLAASRWEDGADGLPRPRAWADVAERKLGQGRIVVLSGATIASNAALGLDDQALFWAALLARTTSPARDGGRVLFDEWTHGYGKSDPVLNADPLFSALALAVAALAALAYLWGAGRRLGPPTHDPPHVRRASVEQVEMLARFYAKAGVTPPAGF